MPTTITNLVPNPSIEVGTTGWGSSGVSSAARSTDWAYSGTASMRRVSSVNGRSDMSLSPALTFAATAHMVSFWVYHEMGRDLEAFVRYNAANQPSVTVPSGVPTRVSGQITGTGLASGTVLAVNAQIGDIFYIDAVLVTEGTTLYEYFDGDSANAVWTGTPHNSTSVLTIPDSVATATLSLGLRMGL